MAETARFRIRAHKVPACHIREYAGSTAARQEEELHLHVKQYTPLRALPEAEAGDALTVVAAHGVGLPKVLSRPSPPSRVNDQALSPGPKELYEPLWDDMYDLSASQGYSIRGIWIADAVGLGLSGELNDGKLSNDCAPKPPAPVAHVSTNLRTDSWMDHARDLLLMVNQFRDLMPRPIVGIGHSFGGCQLTNLAYIHPRLFTSLILLDPVINLSPPAMGLGGLPTGPLNWTTYRQDIWPNRAAAAASQRRASRDWDPRVVQRMIEYGYRDLPTVLYPDLPPDADPANPPVTLTTTKHMEALAQLRANFHARQPDGHIRIDRETHADMDPLTAFVPLYRPEPRSTLLRLPSLRPPTLWVVGEKTFLSLDEMREGIKIAGTGIGGSGGLPQGKVKEVMLRGHGHLLPFTAVKEVARICGEWLGSEMETFRERECKWSDQRAKMTARDHLTLSRTWMEVVKPPSAAKTRL